MSPNDQANDQVSRSGRNWVFGNYIPTRYNHVMTPNTQSCGRDGHPLGLDPGLDHTGGAITASSFHPGGVNLVFADGAVKFASDTINRDVWWALGSRDGGETTPNDFQRHG